MAIIKNQRDLADMLCADNTKASIERNVYKYTDCGAWIDLKPNGIKLGSIVEGSDGGTSVFEFTYPFTEEEYRAAEKAIEAEATAIWDWANVTNYHCVKCDEWFTDNEAKEVVEDQLGFRAVCLKCGETSELGQTNAEAGCDFPDLWQDSQKLKGWSHP
jgi:DNA-directed RNA polymerase subunit RPC12/RpoP